MQPQRQAPINQWRGDGDEDSHHKAYRGSKYEDSDHETVASAVNADPGLFQVTLWPRVASQNAELCPDSTEKERLAVIVWHVDRVITRNTSMSQAPDHISRMSIPEISRSVARPRREPRVAQLIKKAVLLGTALFVCVRGAPRGRTPLDSLQRGLLSCFLFEIFHSLNRQFVPALFLRP